MANRKRKGGRVTPKGTRPAGFHPGNAAMVHQMAEAQQRITEAREAAESVVVTGSAGGGAVAVTLTGVGEVTAVTIDPAVIDPAEAEMLGDLVLAAIRDAQRALEEAVGDPEAEILAEFDLERHGLAGLLGK
jgi:DNA-binding YbaB/EbfC family protein